VNEGILLLIGGALVLYLMNQSASAAQQTPSSAAPSSMIPVVPSSPNVSSSNPLASGSQTAQTTMAPAAFFPAAPDVPAMGPPPGEVVTVPGSQQVYDTGTSSNPQIVDNPTYLNSAPISALERNTPQSPSVPDALPAPVPPDVDPYGFPKPVFDDPNSAMARLYQMMFTLYGPVEKAAANWATLIIVNTGGTIQGPNAAVLFPDNPLRYMGLNEYWQKLAPYMKDHFGLSGLRGWLT